MQHAEARLEQDDVGGVSRDVDRAGDGDPDVGRVERGRIVDAVAEEPDDVAPALEREQDAVLLGGRDAREQGRALGHVLERGVGHRLDRVAEHDVAEVEPDLGADVASDALVVAGHDLDRDAVARERGERLRRVGQDRIGERQKAREH